MEKTFLGLGNPVFAAKFEEVIKARKQENDAEHKHQQKCSQYAGMIQVFQSEDGRALALGQKRVDREKLQKELLAVRLQGVNSREQKTNQEMVKLKARLTQECENGSQWKLAFEQLTKENSRYKYVATHAGAGVHLFTRSIIQDDVPSLPPSAPNLAAVSLK